MFFKSFHPNVRIRIVMNFLNSTAYNTAIPFMAIYFAEKLGVWSAGLLLAFNVGASIIGGIYGGYLADRIGRKKMMATAEALWLAAFSLMALTNSPWLESAWATFAGVVLLSVCWGLFSPASEAMLLDVSTPEERKFMYSFFYWSNNLSIAIGGVIGAMLFRQHLFGLFAGLACMSAISLTVTILFISETLKPENRAQDSGSSRSGWGIGAVLANYRTVVKDRLFLLFMLGTVLTLSVEFQLTNYDGVRLAREFGTRTLLHLNGHPVALDGIRMLAYLRTENTLLVVVLSVIVMRLMSRLSNRTMLFGGMLLYVAGYAFIAWSNQPWALLAVMFFATLGEVANVPIRQALFGDLAPERQRSAYLAVFGISFNGAMLIAAATVSLGGLLPSWAIASGVAIVGFAGILLYVPAYRGIDERRVGTAQVLEADNGAS